MMPESLVYNMDCMAAMREMPDNAFDLAVVDPPYGIEKGFQATSRVAKYGQMQTVNDDRPTKEYFDQLFRVSKNQIVWGYNHLSDLLPKTKEFIFWYKHQPVDTYADGELAYTSFTKTAKCFDYPYFGGTGGTRTAGFTQRRSQLNCTDGYLTHTQNPAIKSSTRILAPDRPALLPMTRGWTLLATKSTRNTLISKRNAINGTFLKSACLLMATSRRTVL